jgi:hypothetical protein
MMQSPPQSPSTTESRQAFIVGCARTGSTVLRKIVNRSDRVCLASETHFFRWARRSGLSARLRTPRPAIGADERLLDEVVLRLYAPDFWIWLRRKVPREVMYERLSKTNLSEQAVFSTLIALYRELGCEGNTSDVIGGEKTPQHLYNVETLLEWFPNCRIIHTFRDPRGIFASSLQQVRRSRWGPKEALRRFVPEGVADAVLTPYQVAHTTVRWSDAVRLHYRYQRLLGDHYIMVRFEDLVSQPELEVRRICDFLSVPFQRAMLEDVDMVGSGYHEERHIGAGLDPAAADRWRAHIHPVVEAWFSIRFSRALRALGYSRG